MKSWLPPTYIVVGSCGENTIGNVHWNLYLMSSEDMPMGLSGHGFTSHSRPVRISLRVSRPPYEPAKTRSGLVGLTAMYPDSPPPASIQSLMVMPPAFRLGPHSVLLSCCAPQILYGKWLLVVT